MADQTVHARHTLAPLVGREQERATLRAALAATLAGCGALVLLAGEAGIGKTALADALLAEAAPRAPALTGRCYDLAETPPYGPWADLLTRAPRADGLYPRLHVVGVDRDAAALAGAQRGADALGVADRLTLRLQDARELDDAAAFDTAQWSQFFFPAETRAATLAATFRALRPGGYPGMPRLPDAPTGTALREPMGRMYSRFLVQYGTEGIPMRSIAELRAELEAAGFAFVRAGVSGRFFCLLAQRPTG